jgi:hypothetical protein
MGEQGTHMQLGGLDLKELEAQRAELVPDRNMMHVVGRRYKKKKYPVPGAQVGVNCLAGVGVAPPGSPCFDGHYHPPRR